MIYLDHAATSWPKAPGVATAVREWYDELGVSADRGDGERTHTVRRRVATTRARLARLVGVPPHRVAFTSGATEAIHLFLDGFLRPGDRVVTTKLEHNAIARPLAARARDGVIDLVVVDTEIDGRVDPAAIEAALVTAPTRLLALTHASNVTGAVLDAAMACTLARANDCASLLDASQTAGSLAIDVGADAVCASAHKSLLGPPGLGFLAVRPECEPRATKLGGTGSATGRALDEQPTAWPAAFEAGTPNTPAILGLGAALAWLETHDTEAWLARALADVDRLAASLADSLGARSFRPRGDGPRLPILSFVVPGTDVAELGARLDEAAIHVRTGFHCAPWIHADLSTSDAGTVRVSPGPFNERADTDRVAAALARRET